MSGEAHYRTEASVLRECGFTPDEIEAWQAVGKASKAMFGLPKLHPSDDDDIEAAIHVLQDKLLGRPAYRKYRDLTGYPDSLVSAQGQGAGSPRRDQHPDQPRHDDVEQGEEAQPAHKLAR